MSKLLLLITTAFVMILPTLARADEWSHTQEFVSAQTSGIRVVDPEGYKVSVEGGNTDTVPAVFNFRNTNTYVNVTLTAPSGESWSKKFEVREYRQTVIRVKHVKVDKPKDAPTAEPQKPVMYVGTVANTTNHCREGAPLRVDFIRGPDVVKSVELRAGAKQSVELAVGGYNIRLYLVEGSEWVFKRTVAYEVKKDGWIYEWGCDKPRR